jgi:hypothetical protein
MVTRLVSGALILGGFVVALLQPTYNGLWVAGVVGMLVGLVGLYVTADES